MSALVRIWSGEHHAWWRADRHGYTTVMREAGLYPRKIAEVITASVGPEKRLALQDVQNEGLETDPRDATITRLEKQVARQDAEIAGLRALMQDGARALPYDRDTLGLMVRDAWIAWAKSQPNPKPSWLVSYGQLSEPDKEADRIIGERIARWTLVGDAARRALEQKEVRPHGQ